jgi:class 3 adenylate cyclase
MSVTAGERRIVSVLVADVAHSTSIAEKLGPERSKFLFDEIVRLMREEVERFGGDGRAADRRRRPGPLRSVDVA